jgi:hypothetical protein
MVKETERKIGECTYCGEIRPLSKGHVPPRNLFPKPYPTNLITVPSCDECNSGSSKDDEYFRLMISVRGDIDSHSEIPLIQEKIISSMSKRKQIGFGKLFLASSRLIARTKPDGLYIGVSPVVIVKTSRMMSVASRIVKGLFYHERKVRLPSSYKATAFPIRYKDLSDPALSTLRALSSKVIGKGVFSYKCQFLEDDPNESGWLMFFYEGAPFFGATVPIGDANISTGEA